METVVVGIDRSRGSRAAGAWAVRQARTAGARLVLGSVSQQCVQHALCPVVVVPAPVPVREPVREAGSAAFA